MSRRFRRWPPAAQLLVAAIVLLIALRAGWETIGPKADPDGASADAVSDETGGLVAGPCEVVRVVDGDTLIVRQSNATRSTEHGSGQTSQFRLRLLGVDTPETVKEDTPVEPFGPEATAFTRRFVANGQARLELDKRRVDRFGRSLAYLYVGEEMLNVELVRAGLARVAHYPGDSQSMHSLLRAAEREAQRERRGIWSLPAPANAP